jgi:hypothetical protein
MSSKKGNIMAKTQHLWLVLSVFVCSISAWSMESTPIEQVYSQNNQSTTQLGDAAIRVIDDFWRMSLDTIMLSEDTEKIVDLRLGLKKYRGDNHLSFYASAYLKTGAEHLKVAMDTVGKWEDNIKKARVERNLMVLIAELGSVNLADLALPKLSSKDSMVRYWAVRSLTSADIISQLKSDVTGDEKLASRITSDLDGYMKATSDTVTLPFVANFAAGINTPASRKLLTALVDQRIDAYIKWAVTGELVDAEILKSLGGLAMQVSDPAGKQELLSRFGQFYAYVLGRYMQGEKLPPISRDQLVTVIAEVEDKVISKQVPGWSLKFRTDLAKNISLKDDYALLFGSNDQAGELSAKLNFNYGKDDSGKMLVSPKLLPPPPQPAVEAKTSTPAAKP